MSISESLRSLLFAPADSARKLASAFASAADVVIADLEDAVAPGQKSVARATLANFITDAPQRRWAVRINAIDTQDYLDDLVAVVPMSPDYIMLPKCAGPDDLRQLDLQISVLERSAGLQPLAIGLLPLVTETAVSLQNLDYRGASPRLRALVFGAEDLSADLGVAARKGDEMTPLIAEARRRTAIAAAAAGVPAIDTPMPDHRNIDGLAREADLAAAMGFAGKLCIHPAQIGPVHAAFAPDPDRLIWAQEVIAAFNAAPDSGVMLVQGAMVDKAHLKLARNLVSIASAS